MENGDYTQQPNGAVLYAKMARIMGNVKRLKKTGHNSFHNYDYATDSDVADTIRDLMAEENIAMFAEIVSTEQIMYQSDKNKTTWRTRCNFVFTLACGDSGAVRSCAWAGEADDTGDKGISKAATSAEKYFLLKTFIMSTGDAQDDADSDSHLETGRKATTRASNGNGGASQQQNRNSTPSSPKSEPLKKVQTAREKYVELLKAAGGDLKVIMNTHLPPSNLNSEIDHKAWYEQMLVKFGLTAVEATG